MGELPPSRDTGEEDRAVVISTSLESDNLQETRDLGSVQQAGVKKVSAFPAYTSSAITGGHLEMGSII